MHAEQRLAFSRILMFLLAQYRCTLAAETVVTCEAVTTYQTAVPGEPAVTR